MEVVSNEVSVRTGAENMPAHLARPRPEVRIPHWWS